VRFRRPRAHAALSSGSLNGPSTVALGPYLRGPRGVSRGGGLIVLILAGEWICAMTRFEDIVLRSFGPRETLHG